MARISYTHKTMDALRKRGFRCGIVERFLSFAGQFGKRSDLFNFIDLIAISDGVIIGVQTTSGSCHSAHKKKIIEECRNDAEAWIKAGGKIELWSWSKKKVKRGGKAVRWVERVEPITLEVLNGC